MRAQTWRCRQEVVSVQLPFDGTSFQHLAVFCLPLVDKVEQTEELSLVGNAEVVKVTLRNRKLKIKQLENRKSDTRAIKQTNKKTIFLRQVANR